MWESKHTVDSGVFCAIDRSSILTYVVFDCSDVIASLIESYDFELIGGSHGHAHLLPESLATCRQVHPDSSKHIGNKNFYMLCTSV